MGKKLYVGNLPFSADDQFLIDTFSECGTVESAKVVSDRDTGRSKGFAFVEMSSDAEALKAIEEFDGATVDGRALRISEARPREQSPSGGRSQFGGRQGSQRY